MAITIGTKYKYSNNVIVPYNCLKIDSTHFVGVYSRYAVRGTVSGTDITYGGEQTPDSYNQKIGADIIDNTHYVTAYYDAGNNYVGYAYIATISGDTITAGNPYKFRSSDVLMVGDNISGITVLDSTHFIIAYTYSVGGGVFKGGAKLGTISAGVISFGEEATFNDANTSNVNVKKLDSTHFVISYTDAGNSSYGTSIIGTISSGNVISYGSEYVFNNGTTYYPNIVKIDTSHIICFYIDVSDSNKLKYNTGSYSGNVITFGTEADIISNSTFPKACLLDTGKISLIYKWDDLGGKGYSNILTATFAPTSTPNFLPFFQHIYN